MTVKTPPEQEELFKQVTKALGKYKGGKGMLIAALRDVQQIFGYLPRKVMILVADELDIPLSEVYSVVSFYSLFSTKPVGRKRIEICMGTACYVKGADKIRDMISDDLEIEPGEMTPDGSINLATSRCVGACSVAPVVKIGDDLRGNITPDKVPELLDELKSEESERDSGLDSGDGAILSPSGEA